MKQEEEEKRIKELELATTIAKKREEQKGTSKQKEKIKQHEKTKIMMTKDNQSQLKQKLKKQESENSAENNNKLDLPDSKTQPNETKNILRGEQRKLTFPNKSQNYCAVYGTLPNQLVDAKSDLAVELMQLFVLQMMNIRQEVLVPGCFINFRGKKMKNAV